MSRIHRLRPAALGVSIVLLLSACATQAPQPPTMGQVQTEPHPPAVSPQVAAAADTLTRMAALQDRLYHVASPLLIENADLCRNLARNLLGFTAKNRYSYGGDYTEAAQLAFRMDEHLQVTGVLAGSGAARAGLHKGDTLLAAGGKPLPTGPQAQSQAGAVFGPLVASQATLPMTIERDGKQRQLPVPVTRACAFAIELGNADNINSYADDRRVMVTRGMMGFARDDDQLAIVLAKGMAHNMLGHAAAQRNSATIGSIIDNLGHVRPDDSMLIGSGGIKAMPAELDVAADRLSLYLLARAGYDVGDATGFWKRLAGTYPPSVLNGYTANHPATGARIVAIEKTVAEIKAKRGAKKSLTP
jgi:hypothetical protein